MTESSTDKPTKRFWPSILKPYGGSRSSSTSTSTSSATRPGPNHANLLPVSIRDAVGTSQPRSNDDHNNHNSASSSNVNNDGSPSSQDGKLFSLRRGGPDHRPPSLPLNSSSNNDNNNNNSFRNTTSDAGDGTRPPGTAPPRAEGPGPGPGPVVDGPAEQGKEAEQQPPTPTSNPDGGSIFMSFFSITKQILLHQWLNVLLVFVPVGIAVNFVPSAPPGVVFAMNAMAIIPLAGLLGYATETVANKMGDSVGALLNITFGNAVELIIFIIALVKNEVRIVQASLLGSILANLLLILGMGFLLGGLRYREQIYNSTVTQMSACLLSLSVISLVLPTAFHASFSDATLADEQSLKISRGTSVILLLVYVIYLLFQLKSHAYMYESMPQHLIDEESTPGPAAAWLETSSSDSSSDSDTDSDSSGRSRDTMTKRMRRVIRAGRRRKNSVASQDTVEMAAIRTPSFGTTNVSPSHEENAGDESSVRPPFRLASAEASEEAVVEERPPRHRRRRHRPSLRRSHRHRKRSSQMGSSDMVAGEETIDEKPENALKADGDHHAEPRRIDFAIPDHRGPAAAEGAFDGAAAGRRSFNLRGMSLRPVAKSLTPTVFTQPPDASMPVVPTGPVPRVRYGIRRTNSLPDRLNEHIPFRRAPGAMLPSQVPMAALANARVADGDRDAGGPALSRRASVLLLLVTTGLVAACATFMVDSINGLVATNSVGETFIGLIVLPIVGNAAEHVTAVTVAMKNKMDLAIGVAVGSSIQIALFITPLIVILGWAIGRDMTLYFTLFETVCLFVSAFIVNFLVLDGRSNYLEGALLCATYIIIGVVAFYYPSAADANQWGQ